MISLKSLGQEFEAVMDPIDFWFDRETEEVVFLDTDNFPFEDEVEEELGEEALWMKELSEKMEANPDGFVKLPSKYEINEWQIMSDFVDERSEGERKDILQDSIHGKGAFRMFRTMVERYDLLEDWYAFKAAVYREKARQWCEENDIEYTE